MNLPRLINYLANASTSHRFKHRHLIAVLFSGSFGVAVLAANIFLPYGEARQVGQRKRVMEETIIRNAPIKIMSVTNRRRPMKFKESFLDDNDWLKGLEFKIKNDSGKTVTHVGIEILFERPADQLGEAPAFWVLDHGMNPFLLEAGESTRPATIRHIRPGETAYVSLSDVPYEDLKSFLKQTRYPASIEKITIWLSTIGFDDGTAWRGVFYIRDPGAPGGWIPKEKSQGSTKQTAAFPFSQLSYHHPRSLTKPSWPASVLL